MRLIPPIYPKPFVRRGKNDANDAAAIATAVRQPDMRFVAVKSQEQQAQAILFRTHQSFTRARVRMMTTLRGQLTEHGLIVPKGHAALLAFREQLERNPERVPDLVLETVRLFYHQINELGQSIKTLEQQVAGIAKKDEIARRIQTMPGVGPVNAAAWLGLVPKQLSTGGKTRLGRVN